MISRAARQRLLMAGLWLLFGTICGAQIQISMMSHGHEWLRVVGSQVLVWSFWIPITFAILRLVEAVPLRPRPGAVAVHGVAAVVVAVAHVALWVVVEMLVKPYESMSPTLGFVPAFQLIALVQLPFDLLLYALVVIVHQALDAMARSHERERKATQLETSLAQARLQALELQTQPHFLFNTLNGIGALVREGEKTRALKMIGGLSSLLRYALDRAGGGFVPLREEVGTVERYLEIQTLRFPDRLTFEVDLEPETAAAPVPAMLLQPLVENAVRHGLASSEASGRIALRAVRVEHTLKIEIINTGRLATSTRRGIGISNTTSRLAELYGAGASFELLERGGDVVARVVLPWKEAP